MKIAHFFYFSDGRRRPGGTSKYKYKCWYAIFFRSKVSNVYTGIGPNQKPEESGLPP